MKVYVERAELWPVYFIQKDPPKGTLLLDEIFIEEGLYEKYVRTQMEWYDVQLQIEKATKVEKEGG